MNIHNAYPELKEIPFAKTIIDMNDVVAYVDSLNCPIAIKNAVYMIFRNEGGNGQHGVNNNYIGCQADGARLGGALDAKVTATCIEVENGTGKTRRFCCFASFKDSIDILVLKDTAKRLFIHGHTNDAYSNMQINNIDDWALAYYQDWVTGNRNAKLVGDAGHAYLQLFESLYNSAEKVIH